MNRRGFLTALVAGAAALGLSGTRVTEAKAPAPNTIVSTEGEISPLRQSVSWTEGMGIEVRDPYNGWTATPSVALYGFEPTAAPDWNSKNVVWGIDNIGPARLDPLTFEAMQRDCAWRGCSLEIHKRPDIASGMVNFTHDSGAPWPHTVNSINPQNTREPGHLIAVDDWRRSLHESGG